MPTCSVKDCPNRTSGVNRIAQTPKKTFHMFPKSKEIRERWCLVTGRPQWVPGSRAVLCSDHFEEQCFDRTGQTTRLRAGALPTKGKWVNRRRKRGRGGGVTLQPFLVPQVKQEPSDAPSYTNTTSHSPRKKRGPGRPRKQVVSESSSDEQDPDDPASALPTDPSPASAPQPVEDPLFMDHYYCRNHQETLAMIQQKEKKAEYLRMKLQYLCLEGDTKMKQELPDWTRFRRATLMEKAEEVRQKLRLSGKTEVAPKMKTEKNEKPLTKAGIIVRKVKTGGTPVTSPKRMKEAGEAQTANEETDSLPKTIKLITTGLPKQMTERIKVVSKKPDCVPEKIKIITGKSERLPEKIQVVSGKPDAVTQVIKVVSVKPEERSIMNSAANEDLEPESTEEQPDVWTLDSQLKQKEQEVNNLLKKIKTLQQRKRRERKRNKARIFRYVVMVEPTKKKRGRPRREEKYIEDREIDDDMDDDDDDDDDDEDNDDEEEEEEEQEDEKMQEPLSLTLDPTSSIQESILSHTASLMMKPKRVANVGQEKDKEIRELKRQLRLSQERERDQAEEIHHLQEIISFLKSPPAKTCESNEIVVVEGNQWDSLQGEPCDARESRKDEAASNPESNIDTPSLRHCHLCHVTLHRRCHRLPTSLSSMNSILDSPSAMPHSSSLWLPFTHIPVRRKARTAFQLRNLPLCSDCRLVTGRRRTSPISPLNSLRLSC